MAERSERSEQTESPVRAGRRVGDTPVPGHRGPPDLFSDDTDIGWGDLPEQPGGDDERILREVPPHHLG